MSLKTKKIKLNYQQISYILLIASLFLDYEYHYQGLTNEKLSSPTWFFLLYNLFRLLEDYYTFIDIIAIADEPIHYNELIFQILRSIIITITLVIYLSSYRLSNIIAELKKSNKPQYVVALIMLAGLLCIIYNMVFVEVAVNGWHHSIGAYMLIISIFFSILYFFFQKP